MTYPAPQHAMHPDGRATLLVALFAAVWLALAPGATRAQEIPAAPAVTFWGVEA